MKIVKFDRSFSSRAITDEVFFFLFLSFFSLSLARHKETPRSLLRFVEGHVSFLRPFHRGRRKFHLFYYKNPGCTSHRRDVGLFVIEGPLCSLEGALLQVLVYRLGRRGGWGLVYTTTRLFSLFLFFPISGILTYLGNRGWGSLRVPEFDFMPRGSDGKTNDTRIIARTYGTKKEDDFSLKIFISRLDSFIPYSIFLQICAKFWKLNR